MDDVVHRLLRELPDTKKDRYDIAYERGRAQARSALLFGGMAIGLVSGALGMFLLDPVNGSGRRAELAQRVRARFDDLRQTLQSRSQDLRNRVVGTATELGLPGTPPSNAERREAAVVASASSPSRPGLRTAPRSAAASTPAAVAPAAPAAPREDTTDRVPVAAGSTER